MIDAGNAFLARALKLGGLTPVQITMNAEPVPLLGRLTERQPGDLPQLED